MCVVLATDGFNTIRRYAKMSKKFLILSLLDVSFQCEGGSAEKMWGEDYRRASLLQIMQNLLNELTTSESFIQV